MILILIIQRNSLISTVLCF